MAYYTHIDKLAYANLEFDALVDDNTEVFSEQDHRDMMIRLARLLCYGNTVIPPFNKETIDITHGNINIKISLDMIGAESYHKMQVIFRIHNPVYFPMHTLLDVVVKSGLVVYFYKSSNSNTICKHFKEFLLVSKPAVIPSIDLEKDVMEWLLDYTNLDMVIDL